MQNNEKKKFYQREAMNAHLQTNSHTQKKETKFSVECGTRKDITERPNGLIKLQGHGERLEVDIHRE